MGSLQYHTEYFLHLFTGNCSINSLRQSAKSVKPSIQNTIQNTLFIPLREISMSTRCAYQPSSQTINTGYNTEYPLHPFTGNCSVNSERQKTINTHAQQRHQCQSVNQSSHKYRIQYTMYFVQPTVSTRRAGSQNNGRRKPSFVQQPT